jgi:hypothetical protein
LSGSAVGDPHQHGPVDREVGTDQEGVVVGHFGAVI